MSLEIDPKKEFKFCAIDSSDARRQFSALLDLCYPVGEGCRFFDDFPVWDPELKAEVVMYFGVFIGNQLICSCAVRCAALWNTSPVDLPVSLIGAVATHPSWRGRGLASLLVDHTLKWSEERGVTVAFLWGSEHSLYQRLGFELCGEQLRVPLRDLGLFGRPSDLPLGLSERDDSTKIYKNWVPELFELIQRRPGGLQLNGADRTWFGAHKNVEWYYSKQKGEPTAYAAYGRGIDLQGIVHEWGGERGALRRILQQIYQANPNAELLGPPSLIGRNFQVSGSPAASEYLCMAKILKPEQFFSIHYPSISINFRPKSGEWELGSDNRCLGVLTQRQLTRQCFGPEQPLGPIGGLPVTSLWIWGLDAV